MGENQLIFLRGYGWIINCFNINTSDKPNISTSVMLSSQLENAGSHSQESFP